MVNIGQLSPNGIDTFRLKKSPAFRPSFLGRMGCHSSPRRWHRPVGSGSIHKLRLWVASVGSCRSAIVRWSTWGNLWKFTKPSLGGGIKPSSSWQNAFFLYMIGYAGTNQPYLDSDFFGLYSGYFGFVMVCPIEIVWFIWIYRQFCNFWALWEMGVITHPSATSRAHYGSAQGPAAWSRTRSHSLRLRRRPVVWGSLPGWHRWKVCQRTRPPGSYRYLRLCHSSNVENPWPSSNWMEMYGKLSNHGKSSNWIFLGVPVAMLDYPRVDMENTTKIQKTSLSFDCWELNNLYLY